jgi:preprotein translocase subunit SecD
LSAEVKRWNNFVGGAQYVIDDGDIDSATAGYNPQGLPSLNLTLSPAGAAKLAQISSANVGRSLAAIVEGKLTNPTTIEDPLTNGSVELIDPESTLLHLP